MHFLNSFITTNKINGKKVQCYNCTNYLEMYYGPQLRDASHARNQITC
jgi:hypothetical protein